MMSHYNLVHPAEVARKKPLSTMSSNFLNNASGRPHKAAHNSKPFPFPPFMNHSPALNLSSSRNQTIMDTPVRGLNPEANNISASFSPDMITGSSLFALKCNPRVVADQRMVRSDTIIGEGPSCGGKSTVMVVSNQPLSLSLRREDRSHSLDRRSDDLDDHCSESEKKMQGPLLSNQAQGPFLSNQAQGPFLGNQAQGPFLGNQAQGPFLGNQAQGPFLCNQAQGPFLSNQAQGPFLSNQAQGPFLSNQAQGPFLCNQAQGPLLSNPLPQPCMMNLMNEVTSSLQRPSKLSVVHPRIETALTNGRKVLQERMATLASVMQSKELRRRAMISQSSAPSLPMPPPKESQQPLKRSRSAATNGNGALVNRWREHLVEDLPRFDSRATSVDVASVAPIPSTPPQLRVTRIQQPMDSTRDSSNVWDALRRAREKLRMTLTPPELETPRPTADSISSSSTLSWLRSTLANRADAVLCRLVLQDRSRCGLLPAAQVLATVRHQIVIAGKSCPSDLNPMSTEQVRNCMTLLLPNQRWSDGSQVSYTDLVASLATWQ